MVRGQEGKGQEWFFDLNVLLLNFGSLGFRCVLYDIRRVVQVNEKESCARMNGWCCRELFSRVVTQRLDSPKYVLWLSML